MSLVCMVKFVIKMVMYISSKLKYIIFLKLQLQISTSFFLSILPDALTSIISRCTLYTPGCRLKARLALIVKLGYSYSKIFFH